MSESDRERAVALHRACNLAEAGGGRELARS
jgi:hypothetical protein